MWSHVETRRGSDYKARRLLDYVILNRQCKDVLASHLPLDSSLFG